MKYVIAGNWKMNMSPLEAGQLAKGIVDGLMTAESDLTVFDPHVEIIVCPPFVSIAEVVSRTENTLIQIGAQNMHHEISGAFTGEISAKMLLDAGCRYVTLGHSERRHVFGEDNAWINKKMIAAQVNGLKPILCVGETEIERDEDRTFNVIKKQLKEGLIGVQDVADGRLVIAYEPVWAIGTGRTATPEQAQEIHAFIRKLLWELYKDSAVSIPLLYGGSVKPSNVYDLLAQPDINGALVGGASLKADSFVELVLAGLKISRN
ncbi:triose-phosphate isomerase [bacterium]|nr:triose-phosphate isomerase [bacterium]